MHCLLYKNFPVDYDARRPTYTHDLIIVLMAYAESVTLFERTDNIPNPRPKSKSKTKTWCTVRHVSSKQSSSFEFSVVLIDWFPTKAKIQSSLLFILCDPRWIDVIIYLS